MKSELLQIYIPVCFVSVGFGSLHTLSWVIAYIAASRIVFANAFLTLTLAACLTGYSITKEAGRRFGHLCSLARCVFVPKPRLCHGTLAIIMVTLNRISSRR